MINQTKKATSIVLLVVGALYQHDPFTIGGPLIMGVICVVIGIKVFMASRRPADDPRQPLSSDS
jgi:hypothetical protein